MVAAIKSARNRKNQPSTHVYTYTCITTSNSLDEGITSLGAEQGTPLDKGWGGSRANWFLGRETRSLETGWSFRDIGELLRTIRMKRILWNRMGPRDSLLPFFFLLQLSACYFPLLGNINDGIRPRIWVSNLLERGRCLIFMMIKEEL